MPCPAVPAISCGLNVESPVRRKITLRPVPGWARETKPSAAMASWNPKWVVANRADASTSGTLSEMAADVTFMSGFLSG